MSTSGSCYLTIPADGCRPRIPNYHGLHTGPSLSWQSVRFIEAAADFSLREGPARSASALSLVVPRGRFPPEERICHGGRCDFSS